MRLGINIPLKDASGEVLDAAGVAKRAQMLEAAGVEGAWLGDSLGGSLTRPDALEWLLVAAAATKEIEVGTAIYILPPRNPVDLAQRFLTLQALTRGRFTIGAGSGSTRNTHDATGVSYEDRFHTLVTHLDTIKRLCNGEQVDKANLHPWPSVIGGPPIVIGAWYSDIWLKKSAQEFDGWMASGGRTNLQTLREGIKRFRDFGGKRALIATVAVDLGAPNRSMTEEESVNLVCGFEEAQERVGKLAALGFDDLLLWKTDHTQQRSIYEHDYTDEQLAQIRALIPRDGRKPYPDRKPGPRA